MSLLEVDEDWRRVWQGMPEFIQQDLMPIKTIYVHFETRADIEAFAALVAQPIGMNTKSIWYPEAEIQHWDRRYIDAPEPGLESEIEILDEE